MLSLSVWSFNALAADQLPALTEAMPQAKAQEPGIEEPKLGIDESKWGLGISGTYDLGAKDRIVSAEVSNGIVRVSGDNNFSARLLLERHFYAASKKKGDCSIRMFSLTFFDSANSCGGFVALQLGSTNTKVLDALGGGYMWGWKEGEGANASIWNFGLGVIADPNTKVLGDGIKKNEALPAGDTLRYKTTTKFGVLALISFGL